MLGDELSLTVTHPVYTKILTRSAHFYMLAYREGGSMKDIDGGINDNHWILCSPSGCRDVFRINTSARAQESAAYWPPPFSTSNDGGEV